MQSRPKQESSRPIRSQLRNPELCQHGEASQGQSHRAARAHDYRPPLGMTVATDRGRSPRDCSITRTRN